MTLETKRNIRGFFICVGALIALGFPPTLIEVDQDIWIIASTVLCMLAAVTIDDVRRLAPQLKRFATSGFWGLFITVVTTMVMISTSASLIASHIVPTSVSFAIIAAISLITVRELVRKSL